MSDRPDNCELLTLLDGLNQEESTFSAVESIVGDNILPQGETNVVREKE